MFGKLIEVMIENIGPKKTGSVILGIWTGIFAVSYYLMPILVGAIIFLKTINFLLDNMPSYFNDESIQYLSKLLMITGLNENIAETTSTILISVLGFALIPVVFGIIISLLWYILKKPLKKYYIDCYVFTKYYFCSTRVLWLAANRDINLNKLSIDHMNEKNSEIMSSSIHDLDGGHYYLSPSDFIEFLHTSPGPRQEKFFDLARINYEKFKRDEKYIGRFDHYSHGELIKISTILVIVVWLIFLIKVYEALT